MRANAYWGAAAGPAMILGGIAGTAATAIKPADPHYISLTRSPYPFG